MVEADLQDLLLRCRAPRSREELFLYCKHQLRVVCESCKGSGSYAQGRSQIVCGRCGGQGSHGFHIARKAVCPGHVAPLDVLWEIYTRELTQLLVIATRGGGKTRLTAIAEHLLCRFHRYTIAHMGAIETQALRMRGYLREQTENLPGCPPFGYNAQKEPTIQTTVESFLPELSLDTAEKARWSNGGGIEFLPGTMSQASGPHPEASILDEVDEADPDVQQKFSKTPTGPRALFLMTSTHTYATGTVSRIKRDNPLLPIRMWCIFESLAPCTEDCTTVQLPNGDRGLCPLFEEEVTTQDGRREIRPLCGGRLARESDGHISLNQALIIWTISNPYTRGVELLCRNPEMGMGAGSAYWAYAPQNVLSFNPEPRLDAPLDWTMDFNPGIGMEMCSLIIQQSPHDPQEFWVIDEIVLPTSSTVATVEEFCRRYWVGGSMLPLRAKATGFPVGVWVFGDATGHQRKSTTGDTDYEVVFRMMHPKFTDFRVVVGPEEANPPLIDRLNRTNEALWEPVSGRRVLKVAPRCERLRDELARMPLKPGTREKDKSTRIQKLGLSHLGDGLEYWVWSRFPYGIRAGAVGEGILLGKRRDSASLLSTGGRRSSADNIFPDPSLGQLPSPFFGIGGSRSSFD